MSKITVTVIEGDGIGKEVMSSVIEILSKVCPDLKYDFQPAGLEHYVKTKELLPQSTLDSITKNKLAIKGPTSTPIGDGHSSINVQLRQIFKLYANVRPVKNIPSVKTKYDNVDLVIIRENTEDLYIGEEQVLDGGKEAVAIKRTTVKACTDISEFAYKYAQQNGRRKITTIHKANILKKTDGLFLKISKDVSKKYSETETNDLIIDNACMQLVQRPERFDMILTSNLYGDILSDLCAGLVGGLGVAPGANIGEDCAIFEAVHGSAPDIAGMGLANPTALIQSAIMMLEHLNYQKEANEVKEALFKALASPNRTKDLGGTGNTRSFTDEILKNLTK